MQINKNKYLLIIFFILLFPSIGFANTEEEIIPNIGLKFGLKLNSFNYEEPGLMEETGSLTGFVVSYTSYDNGYYRNSERTFSKIDVEYMSGELRYDGGTWGGDPVQSDTYDFVVESRFLTGLEFFSENGNQIKKFFLGVGGRYWFDDIEGSGGYQREISYLYVPVGFEIVRSFSKNWKFGLEIEYDLFVSGRVKSYLSDADPTSNDPVVYQDLGYGIKANLKLIYEDIAFEPYVTYWNIQDSDLAALTEDGIETGIYVYEPANETLSYGVRVCFDF